MMPRFNFHLGLCVLALILIDNSRLFSQTPPLVVPNSTPPAGSGIQPTPAAPLGSSPVAPQTTPGAPPATNPVVMPNPYEAPATVPKAGTVFPGSQFFPFGQRPPYGGGIMTLGTSNPSPFEAGRGGWTQSENILIVVSRSGKRVYGYSALTGDLNSVSVAGTGPGELRPLVSNELACFISGSKAYGFSARTGGWSEIDLNGEGAMSYQGKFVAITVGSKTYLYSVAGNWKVIDASID